MQFALGAVTVLALLMTIAMGVVTWRLVREERRRSAARLAALAAELEARGITPRPVDTAVAPPAEMAADAVTLRPEVSIRPQRPVVPTPPPEREAASGPADLFEPSVDSTAGWQRRLTGVGAAGALLATLVSIAIFAMSGGSSAGDGEGDPSELGTERVPVELLTLAHERLNGMLAISGTVRNPEDGIDEPQLSVLAMAFDDDGTMVASGRAQLDTEGLSAGAESAFTISLPAGQASRYRISFLDDEQTVPHLDRRPLPSAGEQES